MNFASVQAPHWWPISPQTCCPPSTSLSSFSLPLKMTRTEIRFKTLTFVLTRLLYDWSVGQRIRSILIVFSGGGVWAGCTSESRGAHKHYAQGKKRHLKAPLPLIRLSLQYDCSPSDLSLILLSGVHWMRQPRNAYKRKTYKIRPTSNRNWHAL